MAPRSHLLSPLAVCSELIVICIIYDSRRFCNTFFLPQMIQINGILASEIAVPFFLFELILFLKRNMP